VDVENFVHFPKAKNCEPYENITRDKSKRHALNEDNGWKNLVAIHAPAFFLGPKEIKAYLI